MKKGFLQKRLFLFDLKPARNDIFQHNTYWHVITLIWLTYKPYHSCLFAHHRQTSIIIKNN